MISCSNVAYSSHANNRELKLVTGLLTAGDKEDGVVNPTALLRTKNTLMRSNTLMAGPRGEQRKDTYKMGKTSDFIS